MSEQLPQGLGSQADSVDDLTKWIATDPLAILICGSAVAEDGHRLPPRVAEAARAHAPRLLEADKDRVREEVERLLMTRDVDLGLQWMHDSGALAVLLPELEATVNFSQEGDRRHKDVWEHTKQVVRQSVRRPAVRWAALLHDIGKVPTRTYGTGGKVHFHGHAEIGARMFKPVAKRFAMSHEFKQKLRFLILHHLRAGQYERGWTDSAVRRLNRDLSLHLTDVLDLSRADITSKRPGRRQSLLKQLSDLAERMAALRELDAKMPPLPKGLGTAITDRFGIPPSKRIGDLRAAMEAACDAGDLEERRDADYYLDWLQDSGLL